MKVDLSLYQLDHLKNLIKTVSSPLPLKNSQSLWLVLNLFRRIDQGSSPVVRFLLRTTLLFTALAGLNTAAATTSPDYHWVSFAPGGLVARAIVKHATNTSCPTITVDGTHRTMSFRSTHQPAGFESIRVCELSSIARSTKSIVIGNEAAIIIPATDQALSRTVVVGDTGCRTFEQENCLASVSNWAYPAIAKAMAGEMPELLIHVGDYHYREQGSGVQTGCTGSVAIPDGDCWLSWELDFFKHAKSTGLLGVAPWVFVRGNHETCHVEYAKRPSAYRNRARAWKGWFYLLDPAPLQKSMQTWDDSVCDAFPPTYKVAVNNRDLWVLDTSNIPSSGDHFNPKRINHFTSELNTIDSAAKARPLWLVSHHPFWATSSFGDLTNSLIHAWSQSSTSALLARTELILSGHIHLFASLELQNDKPHQFVFGGGGTARDSAPVPAHGFSTNDYYYSRTFAYGVISADQTTGQWNVTVKNEDESPISCKLIDDNSNGENQRQSGQILSLCSFTVPYR